MTEIIDVPLALEQANGSEELARDLFKMLINDLPGFAENLGQALAAADNQALWDHAHKLYGSTAYCGVPLLRSAAKELETAIKSGTGDIEQNINRVKSAIQELLDQAETILAGSWSD